MSGRRPLVVAVVVAVLLLGARLVERLSYRGGPPEEAPVASASSSVAAPAPGRVPTRVASLRDRARAIAVDDHDVYAALEGGAVTRVSKGGGSPSTVAPEPAPRGHEASLAVDKDGVYWAEGSAVMRLGKSGGEPTKVAEEPAGNPAALTADGLSVYWSTRAGGGDAHEIGGAIKMLPGEGGAAVVLADAQATPCGLAVDGDNVFWVSGATGSVWRVPKAGGDPVNLAKGHNPATCALAIDASSVYWVERVDEPGLDASTLRRVPKEGGEPRIIAVEPHPVAGLAVDDAFAYFLVLPTGEPDPTEGGVWRVPTEHAAPPEYLARDKGAPTAIAVDAESVYWAGRGSGGEEGIWRLAK